MRNHGASRADWRAAIRRTVDPRGWYVPCYVYKRGNPSLESKPSKNEQGDDYGIDRTRSGLGTSFASRPDSVRAVSLRELRGGGLPVHAGMGPRDRGHGDEHRRRERCDRRLRAVRDHGHRRALHLDHSEYRHQHLGTERRSARRARHHHGPGNRERSARPLHALCEPGTHRIRGARPRLERRRRADGRLLPR